MPAELMEANNQELSANQLEAEQTRSQRVFVPKTDIYESNENLVLLADMPGVSQDNVDITLEQNVLTISGKVEAPKFENYKLSHSEFAVGDYRRVFTLSNEIDREGICASMKNGVLKLVLPKNKQSMLKKIHVQAE